MTSQRLYIYGIESLIDLCILLLLLSIPCADVSVLAHASTLTRPMLFHVIVFLRDRDARRISRFIIAYLCRREKSTVLH
jgi:hypothetical protein